MQTDQGHAVIRLGSTFLLPFWGAKQTQQPVELDITFGPPPNGVSAPQRKGAIERTQFQVKISPRGWPPDAAAFQARARHAFRLLKSSFVAD